MISKREEALDYIVPTPHLLPRMNADFAIARHRPNVFPDLIADILGRAPLPSPQRSPWKQRHRHLRPKDEADVGKLFLKT